MRWRDLMEGMATLNIWGTPTRRSQQRLREIMGRSDEEALRADWEAVIGDIRRAGLTSDDVGPDVLGDAGLGHDERDP